MGREQKNLANFLFKSANPAVKPNRQSGRLTLPVGHQSKRSERSNEEI